MYDHGPLAERIHEAFQKRTEARDKALHKARYLTRHCAQAIRAIHRAEWASADSHLKDARRLSQELREDLETYPDLYHAGYTQSALKEFTEANVVFAMVRGEPLPDPEDLKVEYATYLNGLAESVGELRRRCLDILRDGYSKETEVLLGHMDDIYDVLVTMDYPDAVTAGLRRQTDIVRSINERTRADVTLSLREQHLEESLRNLTTRLEQEGTE